jgi:hypothetical protein
MVVISEFRGKLQKSYSFVNELNYLRTKRKKFGLQTA